MCDDGDDELLEWALFFYYGKKVLSKMAIFHTDGKYRWLEKNLLKWQKCLYNK